jgi:hypothetical protein
MDRALIIKKKWLDQIFDNGKDWEMRTSATKIRGKIGLIESGSGLIVGEAILVGCFSIDPTDASLIKHHKVCNLPEKYRFAWVLSCAKRYPNPVAYQHPQGAVIWVKV